MKKLLVLLLILGICGKAQATDYAKRFPTDTALSVLTPSTGLLLNQDPAIPGNPQKVINGAPIFGAGFDVSATLTGTGNDWVSTYLNTTDAYRTVRHDTNIKTWNIDVGDVSLNDYTTVGAGDNSNIFQIVRRTSPTNYDLFKLFVDLYSNAAFISTQGMVFQVGTTGTNEWNLYLGNMAIGQYTGSANPTFQLWGTESGTRYNIQNQVASDGHYKTTRSNAAITDWQIDLPVDLLTNSLTTTGTLGAGAITGTSLTGSNLTSGYLPVAGTAGLIQNSAGTGFVKVTAGSLSYDNSTYYKSGDSPSFAAITDTGLTTLRLALVSTGGLFASSAEFTYVNDITKPQLTIGSGGYATAVKGVLINPAGNVASQLVLLSTGGAGATIQLGTYNDPVNYGINFASAVAYSATDLEIHAGTGSSYATEIFTAAPVGIGSKGLMGTLLGGVTDIAGSPSAGGSIPNGTYYYRVNCVDYAGTETTKQRGTESGAKVFTGSNGTIVLTWTAIQGAVSYKVYRTTSSGVYTTPCYMGSSTTATYTDTAASPSAGAPPSFAFQGFGSAFSPTGTSWVGGALNVSGIVTGTYFQTSTAPTANSSGTVAIVAKDANLLTNNAGWLPVKKNDGTIVYVPYWT